MNSNKPYLVSLVSFFRFFTIKIAKVMKKDSNGKQELSIGTKFYKINDSYFRCSTVIVFTLLNFFCIESLYAQCAANEQEIILYQTYATNYSDSSNTTFPEYAIGYPDSRYSVLSSGTTSSDRGVITLELDEGVKYQDTLWIRAKTAVANVSTSFRVRTSFNGTTFSQTETYTSTQDNAFSDYFYIVENPVGIKYVLVENIDWTTDLHLESMKYKAYGCFDYCAPNDVIYNHGFGVTVSINSTSTNSNEALGQPDGSGAELDGNNNAALIIDLGDTIPFESNVIIYVANEGEKTPFVVSSSLSEPNFGSAESYEAIHQEDVYTPVVYEVKFKTGIRFLKIQMYEDSLTLFVDAAEYYYPDLFGSSAISGIVFKDANGNGELNFGEQRVDSAVVSLYHDVNYNNKVDVFDILLEKEISDSLGGYLFRIYDYDLQYLVKFDQNSIPNFIDMTTLIEKEFSGLNINESYCQDFGFQDCLSSCKITAEDDKFLVASNGSSGSLLLTYKILDNDIGPVDSTTVSIIANGQAVNGTSNATSVGELFYVPNPHFAGLDSVKYEVCNTTNLNDCDTGFVLFEVNCPTFPGQNFISGSIFDDVNTNGKFEQSEVWTQGFGMKIYLRSDLNGNGLIDHPFDVKVDSAYTAGDGSFSFLVAAPNANHILEIDVSSGPPNIAFTTPLTRSIDKFDGFISKCGNTFGLTYCGPNCPPVAIQDAAVVSSGVAKFINVLENDLDFDHNIDPFSLQILSPPSHGNVIIGRDGLVVYYSDANYVGPDQFTYQICDQTNPTPLCSSTTVDFSVIPGFDDPCAEAVRTHTYYIPFPENELRPALINSASSSCGGLINNVARSISTIKSPYPGVEIYYDHWEDGYETNIKNPLQNTSLIWGDEDLTNGIAPGYPDDFIPAGGSIILDNNIFFNPRDPNDIAFDGKDKLFTTGDVAISKFVGDINQIHVQAAKTDVYDTERFGTSFIIPFGEDLNNEFQYTSLFIRAESDNTEVLVDKDNDGVGEESQILDEGEVMFVDGGVLSGATVSATKRVGLDVLFGGKDCFGTRQVNLMPGKYYSNLYYSPVPTTLNSSPAAVYLNNNLATSITVVWTSKFNTGNIVIPSKSTTKFILSDNSGYRFETPSGESFTAIEVMDSDASGSAYDWAFNLISDRRLTSFASVAWAPGSRDGSGNFNPIWVTPTASTTVYIKHDGDITTAADQTSPCGLPFDEFVTMDELDYHRIFDDEDNQQSGTAIYTCDGVTFAAVYGLDPVAGAPTPPASPSMDVGTTIQPMCINPLIIANDDYEVCQPSDFVVIAVIDNDNGFLTEIDPASILTTGLREPGYGDIEINDNGTIVYTPFPGWEGVDTFEYSICSDDITGLCDVATVVVTVQPCTAKDIENLVNGLVYLEKLPDDGEFNQETRVPDIIVHLIGDTDCDGIADPSELIIESTVTDASGAYSFKTINGEFVKDEFDDPDNPFSGNFGSISWSNAWQEVGVSNGFNNSTVTIGKDAFFPTNALIVNGGSRGASRTVNAVDAKKSSLKFSYRRQSLENTGEALNVSINNNIIYTINDGNGINTDYFYKDVVIEVPIANIDPNGPNTLSFITNGNVTSGDYFYIDNVEFIFNQDSVCFVTKVDVKDKNGSFAKGSDSTATAVFGSDLGDCENEENQIAVLASYIARNDYSSGIIDNPQVIKVLENDNGNPHLPSLSTTGVLQPSNGAVSITGNGNITYIPNSGFEGVDSFGYFICSSDDHVVCDQAQVYVSISCLELIDSNSISGSVFSDVNSNGHFDLGERLFEGISVLLFEDVNRNGVLDPIEKSDTLSRSTSNKGNFQFIVPPKIITQTLSIPIELGVDDAMESKSGTVQNAADKLTFSRDDKYVGMRFQNVQIPKNSIIADAKVYLTASDESSSYTHLIFGVDKVDNAPAFSTSHKNISKRWNTDNIVNWYDVPATTLNDVIASPDLSPLIREIINRPNWNIGNSIALIVKRQSGWRSFWSIEGDSPKSAVFEVTFASLDYPANYVAVIDTASFSSNLNLTTAPSISLQFAVPGEAVCRNNFGIYRNTTQAINDVNKTITLKTVEGNVLDNDFDIEGDDHTFSSFLDQNDNETPIFSGATLSGIHFSGGINLDAGKLYFPSDGSGDYSFEPSLGFTGSVFVSYEKCDDHIHQACSNATLKIGVTEGSDPYDPIINGLISVDDSDVSYGGEIIGNILSNDSDPEKDIFTLQEYHFDSNGDGVLNVQGGLGIEEIVAGINSFGNPVASAGKLTLYADGFYRFTPFMGFEGDVVIEYEICDDYASPYEACDKANLFIKVILDNVPLNSPPFASDDFVITGLNTSIVSDWISNDGDPDNDFINFMNVPTIIDPLNLGANNLLTTLNTVENGTVKIYEDGLYEYFPPLDYSGPDNVKYFISDVGPQSLSDSATIYFLVEPIGFDYGDLSPSHSFAGSVFAADTNNDGRPDLPTASWLGQFIDSENKFIYSDSANGDNILGINDEDGIIFPKDIVFDVENTFKVIVSSNNSAINPNVGLWMDWNLDGTFDDFFTFEADVENSGNRRRPGAIPDTFDLNIVIPPVPYGQSVGVRLRNSNSTLDFDDYQGLIRSGEIEDYSWKIRERILPVLLVDFYGYTVNDQNNLFWHTAAEVDNEKFEIERSKDGVSFAKIGEVEGHGTSVRGQSYQFVDEDPFTGINYYRLKQKDFDGTFEYSNIISLIIDKGDDLSRVNIFPNPVKNMLSIDFSTKQFVNRFVEFSVTSMTGAQLIRHQIDTRDASTFSYNIGELPGGVYLVEIKDKHEIISEKIMKY